MITVMTRELAPLVVLVPKTVKTDRNIIPSVLMVWPFPFRTSSARDTTSSFGTFS